MTQRRWMLVGAVVLIAVALFAIVMVGGSQLGNSGGANDQLTLDTQATSLIATQDRAATSRSIQETATSIVATNEAVELQLTQQ